MSIKKLFSNYSNKNFVGTVSEHSISAKVESLEYVKEKNKDKERYIPIINFATASNFAKFGSAELYYEYGFKRIY